MLKRYKRKGGFIQLLQLIETCNEAKREKLLSTIAKEDSRWSTAIESKLLTLDRIFTWKDESILEIIPNLHGLTLATTINALNPALKERVLTLVGHLKRRQIEDVIAESSPSEGEVFTCKMKVIEEVRGLITQGYIHLNHVDPDLFIEDDIEDILERQELTTSSSDNFTIEYSGNEPNQESTSASHATSSDQSSDTKLNGAQLTTLKNELKRLKNENIVLKNEVKKLKKQLQDVQRIVSSAA